MWFILLLWMVGGSFGASASVNPLAEGYPVDEPLIKHLHWYDGKPGRLPLQLCEFWMHEIEVTISTRILVSCFFNKATNCHVCEAQVAWISIEASCDALFITVPNVNATNFDNCTIIAQGVNPLNISRQFRITVKNPSERESNSPDGPLMMDVCNGKKPTGLSSGQIVVIIGALVAGVILIIAIVTYRRCRHACRQEPRR